MQSHVPCETHLERFEFRNYITLMVTVWISELQGKITSFHVVATRNNGQVILATEELRAFIKPLSLLTQSVVDGMHLPHGKTG